VIRQVSHQRIEYRVKRERNREPKTGQGRGEPNHLAVEEEEEIVDPSADDADRRHSAARERQLRKKRNPFCQMHALTKPRSRRGSICASLSPEFFCPQPGCSCSCLRRYPQTGVADDWLFRNIPGFSLACINSDQANHIS
jgi:hypothetical protein